MNLLLLGKDGFIIGLTSSEHVVDDAGQFVCSGGDGLGCAEFAPHASEEVAEIGRAMMQCLGSEPQRQGGSALQFSCPEGDFATRDLPVRAQR